MKVDSIEWVGGVILLSKPPGGLALSFQTGDKEYRFVGVNAIFLSSFGG
jgi:hypothetical protein